MENALTKLLIYVTLGAFTVAALKVFEFYLLHKWTKEKAKAKYKKEDLIKLEEKKIKSQLELEDILKKGELDIYYSQARDLFHDAIQAGNLNHEQILYLKKIINESLGTYIDDYKFKRYTNDAHEIYSKLKSSHISIDSFKRIIQLIKMFEAQSEGEFLTVVPIEEKKSKLRRRA